MPSTSTDRLNGITTSVAVKPPVRVVSTANLTLSGEQTVDSVAVVDGDRVLVKDQSNAIQNGIYVVSTGDWTRAKDFDGNRDVVKGTLVVANNDDSIYWRVSSDDPIIDYDDIDFELVSGAITQTIVSAVINPRSDAEAAVPATPVDYSWPYGWANRFKTNTTPGATDMVTGLQKAIDAADLSFPKVRLTHQNAISQPLLIRSTSVESLVLEGEARTISIIEPSAIDISQAAQNVNALIINQANNGHLHLQHMRFYSSVAYTGQVMYSVEGGCADGSGQAAFSPLVEDCWFSLSSTNTGYMRGGFSNMKVTNCTYENCKDACWILEGVANADQQYLNGTQYICYDNFIRATDSNIKAVIQLNQHNAYGHLRGRLIEFVNGIVLQFSNVIMEPDIANLGDCGLFKFTDCNNMSANNCTMLARAGVPGGAVGMDIINGHSGTYVGLKFNADTGLKFSGAGVLDITFIDCEFTDCDICWDISGTQSGKVRFLNCKMSNAQTHCIVVSGGTPAFNVEWTGGEIVNAGLGGSAGSRNIVIAGAGNWTFRDVLLGWDTGSAVAAYFVDASGAGVVKFDKPVIQGTPPTGLKTGAQTVAFEYSKGYGDVIASATTLALPFAGDTFEISGTTGIASIDAGNQQGRRITLVFQATPTVTDGSNLLMAGNFVASAQDTLSLVCVGTNWFETGRSVN